MRWKNQPTQNRRGMPAHSYECNRMTQPTQILSQLKIINQTGATYVLHIQMAHAKRGLFPTDEPANRSFHQAVRSVLEHQQEEIADGH